MDPVQSVCQTPLPCKTLLARIAWLLFHETFHWLVHQSTRSMEGLMSLHMAASVLYINLTSLYCIGTWNVRFTNLGKLDVVKQEMTRINIDILGIN